MCIGVDDKTEPAKRNALHLVILLLLCIEEAEELNLRGTAQELLKVVSVLEREGREQDSSSRLSGPPGKVISFRPLT